MYKKLISYLLILVTVVNLIVLPFSVKPAYADSNDVRKSMINFFKGKQIEDVDKEALKDPETLRFLSLFVSNFYTPLVTTFDDEDTNHTKDNIVSSLVSCNFDKETAETLVELIYKYTLSTAKPLYVNTKDLTAYDSIAGGTVGGAQHELLLWDNEVSTADSDIADGRHFNCTSDKTLKVCSYGVFLELMSQVDSAPIFWADSEETAIEVMSNEAYVSSHTVWDWNPKKGHSAETDSSSTGISLSSLPELEGKGIGEVKKADKIVFTNESLVSLASYLLVANELNYSWGYGNGFYMYTENMDTISKMKLNDDAALTADDPKSDAWKACAMTAPLYVDWVGNIIADTGYCRYLVVPACQNPYSWSSSVSEAGSFLNGVSLFALQGSSGNSDSHSLQYQNTSHYAYNEKEPNMGYMVNLALGTTSNPTLMTVEQWKQYVGSNSNEIDHKLGWGKGEGYDLLNAMYVRISDLNNPNNMYSNSEWLAALKGKKGGANPDSGFHASSNHPQTGYLGMTTIGDKGDISSSGGVDASEGKKYLGKIPAFGSFVWFDSLNILEGTDEDDSHLKLVNYYKGDKEAGRAIKDYGNSKFNSITIGAFNVGNYTWARAYMDRIYLTYLVAYVNAVEDKSEVVDLKFESTRFPTETEPIDWGTIAKDKNSMMDEFVSFGYYFLHPKLGVNYIASWIKTKLGGVLLSWHKDIVGGGNSNASTGMTSYLGFSSYTTLPNLYDIKWIAAVFDSYNSIIVFLIVLTAVVLCCYVIVGSLTLQRGLFGVLMFGLVAFLPPIAITVVTNNCNKLSDKILSSKFEYWALVQHQTYLQDLYELAASKDSNLYGTLVGNMQVRNDSLAEDSVAGYAGVKLKWMSPKKDNYLSNLATDLEKITSNSTLKSLAYNIISPGVSGETFLDSNDALYLYRDYVDITNYAMKGYNLYSLYNGGGEVSPTSGTYHLDTYTRWSDDSSRVDSPLGYLTYASGFPFSDMVLRNVESGYRENNFSKEDDLYGATSIFALRNGFLNNTTSYSEFDIGDENSNLNYYKASPTSSLHVNYLLNYLNPYGVYMSNYNTLRALLDGGVAQRTNVLVQGVNKGTVSLTKLGAGGAVQDLGGKQYYTRIGLDPHKFNFSVSDFSKSNARKYSYDNLGYFYYSLYSESPYYYFNWVLQDSLNNSGLGYSYSDEKSSYTNEDYVNHVSQMLLDKNQDFFFNYSPNAGDGYGELKDYMNLHDLFYYVIPILQEGSNLADYFDRHFDIKMYEDMPVSLTKTGNVLIHDGGSAIEIGVKNDSESDSSETSQFFTWNEFDTYVLEQHWTNEQIYKFWHNYELITVLEAYSAWTDTMTDCYYAKPEKIPNGNSKFVVENPLDPTSYFDVDESGKITAGRYMVFSRSEMKYYGLAYADLTSVEQKIITVQDNVYKNCISLMNYSNFDDDVAICSLAMSMLFEFNSVFSENSLTGEGHMMYPMGYELKAFTYDAYMRLILSEATGEDLMSMQTTADGVQISGDLYSTILSKTSIFFAVFLVILDILVTYIIPLMRLLFLICVFLLSIVVIASEAVKLQFNLAKVLWKALVAPLLVFGVVSVGLSWLTSLFMSNGNEGVIKGATTISLGDPTMTVIAMLILNFVVTILYWKVLSGTFKNLKTFTQALATSVGGTVVGAAGAVVKGFTAGAAGGFAVSRGGNLQSSLRGRLRGSGSGSGTGIGGHSTAGQRGLNNTSGAPKPKLKERVSQAGNKVKETVSKAKDLGNKYDKAVEQSKKASEEQLETAKKQASAFKNKDVGIINRVKNGTGAFKNGVRGGVNKLKYSTLNAAKETGDTVKDMAKYGSDSIKNGVSKRIRRSKLGQTLFGRGSYYGKTAEEARELNWKRTNIKPNKSGTLRNTQSKGTAPNALRKRERSVIKDRVGGSTFQGSRVVTRPTTGNAGARKSSKIAGSASVAPKKQKSAKNNVNFRRQVSKKKRSKK